jgi:hypothetical protein
LVAAAVVLHLAASVAYGVRDVRAAAVLHGQWPAVEAVAAAVPQGEVDRVAASHVDRRRVLMLQLLLDRPIEDARRAPPSAGARWVLLGAEEPPPEGFAAVPVAGSGSLKLAARSP